MALDQSALLDLLEALKAAEVDDRIRTATEALYQALIEAELTAVIGGGAHGGGLCGAPAQRMDRDAGSQRRSAHHHQASAPAPRTPTRPGSVPGSCSTGPRSAAVRS
jgi:hypothetical protein